MANKKDVPEIGRLTVNCYEVFTKIIFSIALLFDPNMSQQISQQLDITMVLNFWSKKTWFVVNIL